MFFFFRLSYSDQELVERLDILKCVISEMGLDWDIVLINKFYPNHFSCIIPGSSGMPCYSLYPDGRLNHTGWMMDSSKAVDYIHVLDLR